MAGSINKVILVGNVGKDPESRSFQNGGKVVNFSLATSETWNDRSSGERKEKTEWHNVVVRNEKIGEVVERYVQKGSKLYVEGSIQSRQYTDRDGNERYITEIVVGPFRGEITLLDRKQDREAAPGVTYQQDRHVASPALRAPAGAGSALGDLDDEIPF